MSFCESVSWGGASKLRKTSRVECCKEKQASRASGKGLNFAVGRPVIYWGITNHFKTSWLNTNNYELVCWQIGNLNRAQKEQFLSAQMGWPELLTAALSAVSRLLLLLVSPCGSLAWWLWSPGVSVLETKVESCKSFYDSDLEVISFAESNRLLSKLDSKMVSTDCIQQELWQQVKRI